MSAFPEEPSETGFWARFSLSSGLLGGLLGGAHVGAWGAWATFLANDTLRGPRDRFVFAAGVAATAALCAVPIGLAVQLVLARSRRAGPGAVAWGVALFAAGASAVQLAIGMRAPWRLEAAPPDLALGALGGFCVVLLGRRLLGALARPAWTAFFAVGGVLAIVLAVGTPALGSPAQASSPPADVPLAPHPSAERVVVLGIDGADWRSIDPLLEAGEMPQLERILRAGARSPLRVDRPTWSPILWTTIATGVPAERHGVRDFTELVLPGMETGLARATPRYGEGPRIPRGVFVGPILHLLRELGIARDVPITARHRRAPAIWNLASRAGIEVGVVNWYATWPCEVVNGCMLADHDPSFRTGERLTEAVAGADDGFTYPPDLIAELGALLPAWWPRVPAAEDLEGILESPVFEGIAAESRSGLIAETLADIGNSYLGDRLAAEVGIHLMEERGARLVATYLPGVDRVSHRVMVRPEVGLRVLANYYRAVDALLEPYADRVEDGRILLVLVSDHGWHYSGHIGHHDAPDGIFAAAGAGLVAGGELAEKPHLLDIAPTVLAALGCPPAAGMPGRVLAELFASPPALTQLEYGSYEPVWSIAAETLDSGSLDGKLDELKRLGYVE